MKQLEEIIILNSSKLYLGSMQVTSTSSLSTLLNQNATSLIGIRVYLKSINM